MAVGNTINYSIPVVGSTVSSVARAHGDSFSKDTYSIGGGTFPILVTLRGSSALGARKRFGATITVRPSVGDDPGTLTKGSATVSVNIDAQMGSVVDATDLAAFVRHSLSMMLHSNLIEDLSSGITL